MRLRLIVLICLLLCARGAFASCTGSSPTWTTTIDQSSVTTCISNASSGDTINVSSGSATWSSITISSSKAVTLACPSMSCNVTMSAVDAFDISFGSTSTGTVITGFSFSCTNTGFEGCIQFHLATSASGPYATTPRFYNNTTTAPTSTQTTITFFGFGPMLFDHNSLTGLQTAAEIIHLEGGGNGCTNATCWSEDVTPGSGQMLVMENNLCTSNGTSNFAEFEEAYYGTVATVRYNKFNNCQVDAHANNGTPGARWMEWYNNFYNQCPSSGEVVDWRGGSGIFANNTSNNCTTANITAGPTGSDSTGSPPVANQLGMGIGGTSNITPAYSWGTDPVEQNPGTQGPANMTKIGSTYNGCSGWVGSYCTLVNTTTQPSTLERCESAADVTAGCPVSYTYTPYTYPHPLDNCSTATFGAGGSCGNSPAATPVCTPGSGSYTTQQSVTCTDGSSGAIMCYTVNGAAPATNGSTGCTTGTLYTTALTVPITTTLSVIAGGTGYSDSSIATYSYAIPTAARAVIMAQSATVIMNGKVVVQ